MAIKSIRAMRFMCLAAMSTALLSACGGSSSTAPTISGVAAVGVPIVNGLVKVSCAGGSAMTATTSSTGAWTVTTSGQTLPCAVQVSAGTVGGVVNTTPYHSIAISFGTVNITPLTDLAVAQMVGVAPQAWFAGPTFTEVNTTALGAALNTVSTSLGLSSTLGTVNPFTTAFLAQNGDKIDDILEAIKTTLSNQSKTYADLLAAAQAGNYTAFSGFGTGFSTVYVNLTGNGGSGAGGSGTLTIVTTISGVSAPSVVVTGITKPANQSDFCGAIQSDSSITSLSANGGSLTINSCSFSGNVGTVAATLSVTTPFAFTTSYTITYTYS
jgi:hypothetical protein